jgi:hypothetical protein
MSAGAVKRRSWSAMIASQSAFLGLLYFWQIIGNSNAGNLFQFLLWATCAASIISAFITPDGPDTIHIRTRGQDRLSNFYCTVMIAALAWFGLLWLATAFLLGAAASRVYREKFDADGRAKSRA